jgi:hypothetical protein
VGLTQNNSHDTTAPVGLATNSTLSPPATRFADHAATCREALGRMLLHPFGELRRAHQAGAQREISKVGGGDDKLAAVRGRGQTAQYRNDLYQFQTPPSIA